MMIPKQAQLAALALMIVATFQLGTSWSSQRWAPDAEAGMLEIGSQRCAASVDGWMQVDSWPAQDIVLGDQIYGRARLWNLSHSKGNAVADLALAMATAQLNLAAGAKPSVEVIDALFEADTWLLDTDAERRRPQVGSTRLSALVSVLDTFNDRAALSECKVSAQTLALAY